MRTAFVWHERTMWHDLGPAVGILPPMGMFQPGVHFEHPETKRRFKNLLDGYGLTPEMLLLTPDPATDEDLAAVHGADYLARVKALSDGAGGDTGELAPIPAGGDGIARLSAGAAILALDAVLDGRAMNVYSMTRPPGHHAEPDRGMGFCIYANIAIAIKAARRHHGVGRVAVVDWDVHHGNGTESCFYEDPDTLTISLHQDGFYPRDRGAVGDTGSGDGVGSSINIPLPPGSGRGAYLHAFDRVVEPALKAFRPELIIVASGFDSSGLDPLGRMMLTAADFGEMTRRLMLAARESASGRLAVIHEGGYSEAYVPFCGLAVVEALSGLSAGCGDPLDALIGGLPGTELMPHQEAAVEAARAAAPLLRA